MEAAAAAAFDAQGAVARHAIDKPLEPRQIVRQPLDSRWRLAIAGTIAMVIESLCTSIPRWMIG